MAGTRTCVVQATVIVRTGWAEQSEVGEGASGRRCDCCRSPKSGSDSEVEVRRWWAEVWSEPRGADGVMPAPQPV